LTLIAPALDRDLLERLAAAAEAVPGATLHVEQPQMTDIFRRVLARRTQGDTSAAAGPRAGAANAPEVSA
jgi:hypothetical protein